MLGGRLWEISIVVRWVGGHRVVVVGVVDWRWRIVLRGVSGQKFLRGGCSELLDLHVAYAQGHRVCRGVVDFLA